MRLWNRLAPFILPAASSLALLGCSTCDAESIDRAVAFIDAHQSCETNADCVVVSDMCEEIPGGWCGQIPMNRESAESSEWRTLANEVQKCGPDSCAQCAGALTPSCSNGSCGGRR